MNVDRRTFLCGATATMFGSSLVRALRADAAASNLVLVVFNLGGGNDGFNTVIPLAQYGTYIGLRPTIGVTETAIATAGTAFDANFATPASMATTYAFNPVMTKLRGAYARGHLAVIMGSALPPNSYGLRSHPDASFTWQAGVIDKYLQTTYGWGGGALDQFGTVSSTLAPMISASGSSPLLFGSTKNDALAFGGTLEQFRQTLPRLSAADSTPLADAISAIDAYPTGNSASELFRETATTTAADYGTIAGYAAKTPGTDYVTAVGSSGKSSNIKQQFQQVARLLLSGSDSKLFYVHMDGGQTGSFDTHSNQLYNHPYLLQNVSEAMVEFVDYITAKNAALAQRVVVMTISEFGRKPNENSTGGTDHGSSSVHVAMGARVKGGVYGQYPSLLAKDLQSGGYAQVTVDFRNYISDVVAALGADPAPLVGGATYPKLGFI